MLTELFYTTFAFYFLLLLSRFTGHKILETVLCGCAVLVNLWELAVIYSSGYFPVFNIFESFLFITFLLGGMGIFLFNKGYFSIRVRKWIWIEINILFIIMLFFPKEASPPLYDYGYSYIILFHAFRCIALAFMLYAAAWFIQFIIQREIDERTNLLAHQGRNFLVLAAVFYLMGEYVGVIWCQKGWGDFWMWNQTFLQSTLIVLYLMIAFHIPGKGRKAEDIRCIVGGLSGVFFLALTVMRSLY